MATLIDKYSIEKMIDRYQKELDNLFSEQESSKLKYSPSNLLKAKGGMKVPKYTQKQQDNYLQGIVGAE